MFYIAIKSALFEVSGWGFQVGRVAWGFSGVLGGNFRRAFGWHCLGWGIGAVAPTDTELKL